MNALPECFDPSRGNDPSRRYWNAWQDLTREAGVPAGDPAATPWHEGFEQWARMFAGPGKQSETIERVLASAKGFTAFVQSMIAAATAGGGTTPSWADALRSGFQMPGGAGSPFANPLAEARSNLQRVAFAFDAGNLREGRYAVLDRAPNSMPAWRDLLPRAGELRLRYLGCDRVWREAWPPGENLPCQPGIDANAQLPRAVEFRIAPPELGEIRRVVELVAPAPSCISGNPPPC